MKVILGFVGLLVFELTTIVNFAQAQVIRSDGGVIVMEDKILAPLQRQVVFIATQTFPNSTVLQLQTVNNEGIVHSYKEINLSEGLKQGQMIQLWNGEFSRFETSAWLRFNVTITSNGTLYYYSHMTPIGYAEQYKEPMITEIVEMKDSKSKYSYFVQGNFDRYSTTVILINSNIVVDPSNISYPSTSGIRFDLNKVSNEDFPPGKFLLTICQAGHCDTMIGRHR